MTKTKKETKSEEVVETAAVPQEEPLTNSEYKKLIETYKKQSPAKYESKKAELEAKLKANS